MPRIIITDYKNEVLAEFKTTDYSHFKTVSMFMLDLWMLLHEPMELAFKRMAKGGEFTYMGTLYKGIITI